MTRHSDVSTFRTHRFPDAQVPLPSGGLPTASTPVDIEALCADAFGAGYAEGQAAGDARGREAGWAEGHAAGHAEGRAAGEAAARKALQSALVTLVAPLAASQAAVNHLHTETAKMLAREVEALTEQVVRTVLQRELVLAMPDWQSIVEATLAEFPVTAERIEIFLPPSDCQAMQATLGEAVVPWQLIPDATLAEGECRVRTGELAVDAGCGQRLDACLVQVREQLAAMAHAMSAKVSS